MDGQAPGSPPSEASHRGATVAVYSAKGGGGATTVAVNLAAELRARGRSVCLVDLDLEYGDVGVALGIEPRRSILDAITVDVPDDLANPLDLLRTNSGHGFDCILAPVEPSADKVPAPLVIDLLELARESYDITVVDLPSHLSEQATAALGYVDTIALVVTPDAASMKSTNIAGDLLDRRGRLRSHRLLVINQVLPDGAFSAADVARVVEGPVVTEIPFSTAVRSNANAGDCIVLKSPTHPVSAAVRRLADAWSDQAGNNNDDEVANQRSRWRRKS